MGAECYRPLPGAAFHFGNGAIAYTNRRGYRGPEVEPSKPPGVFRIVLLGGSTTHGFGVSDGETIDASLRELLVISHPGRAFDVVNLGFSGYDSACDYERMRADGVALAPDALVLHSGINDVPHLRSGPNVTPALHPFESVLARLRDERRRGGPRLWSLVKHASLAARAPGLLRHAWRGNPRAAPLDGPATPQPEGLDLVEATLRRTAELTDPRTLLFFSTPPSALRFPSPPAAECQGYRVVDAVTTQRYRDGLDERMQRAARTLAARGRRAAYVPHDVPVERFLDDCHLDAQGNRLVAADFAAALAPFLSSSAQ